MYQFLEHSTRDELDNTLAEQIAVLLNQAIKDKGKASIAVSGGSTPKGLFKQLAAMDLEWSKVTITLADERWVNIDSDDSNTRLVHENLLQGYAAAAKFFYLKQGDVLTNETLADLNLAAEKTILPLDVLILGMGEDGHTASLFPCSEQIKQGLNPENDNALMSVQPKTAPHQRITFTFSSLSMSKVVILHLCGKAKKDVVNKAIEGSDLFEMPIRAFLHHPTLNTQIFWAP
ncbi:6-phosphogluconolactonase [Colwellia sp. RSH04]|uniref:6-phosphogluconolactonase n=1 Tax=Colwellia sp. RSH04 TaxID=2305464 RepID=UPI000E56A48E|nr:6-phosphogluconolactonase [Colwellia sp. RSH04]RHW77047.1 6-phosphogluconolactonase [Colwellia sp. RSH04]